MAKIMIYLSKNDIETLLLGGGIDVKTHTKKFDNLTGVSIMLNEYSFTPITEEVSEDEY